MKMARGFRDACRCAIDDGPIHARYHGLGVRDRLTITDDHGIGAPRPTIDVRSIHNQRPFGLTHVHILTSDGDLYRTDSMVNYAVSEAVSVACTRWQKSVANKPDERHLPPSWIRDKMPRLMVEQPPSSKGVRRGRPPGRSVRQEEQRRQNRALIVAAAASVFAERPYPQATIDDILAAAGISRATFYAHFETKLALAMEIYDSTVESWLAEFDRLPAALAVSIDDLKRWILSLADLYVQHGYVTPLVEQLAVLEPGFRQRLARDRDAMIGRLARSGVPGCLEALGSGREALLQCARVRLSLQRLDQICGLLVHSDALPPEEVDAYVHAVAEELQDILG